MQTTDIIITCPQCGARIPITEALARQVREEVGAALRKEHEAQLRRELGKAEARSRDAFEVELQDLRRQLAERAEKARQAQESELALRKRARELEDRQQEMDLEIQRRLSAERAVLEQQLRKRMDGEHHLRLREKEQQIEGLRKALEEARRRSEQGSQQTQGEALEVDIELVLSRSFPRTS